MIIVIYFIKKIMIFYMVESCIYIHGFYLVNVLPSRLGLKNTLISPPQWGKTPRNECSGYDRKQSNGEVPVILELWGM